MKYIGTQPPYISSNELVDGSILEADLGTALGNKINGKQDQLVSGTNVKSVNGGSILGSGNLTLVTPSGTEVLSNKTLTSPVITEDINIITGNTTAVKSKTYDIRGTLVLTLPITPSAGDWVRIISFSGFLTSSIGRNGSNIMGLAENMTVDKNISFRLLYVDATQGWIIQ